ncbi:MAG: hypothetical protein LBK06_04675 [Planctomycetaceae bacterium]|jgi:hypothetical protein|nr:hypothetical protein [Planctomycetaceae bacterium]
MKNQDLYQAVKYLLQMKEILTNGTPYFTLSKIHILCLIAKLKNIFWLIGLIFIFIPLADTRSENIFSLSRCPVCEKDALIAEQLPPIYFEIVYTETLEKIIKQFSITPTPLSLEIRYFETKDCSKFMSLLKKLDSNSIVELDIILPEYVLTKADVCWLLGLNNLKKLGLQVKNDAKPTELFTPFLFDNLGELSNLTHLYFSFGKSTKETDSFLNYITKNISLTWICLQGITFPKDKIWSFPKNIKMVLISGSILTSKEFGIISKSKSITHLSIINNEKYQLSPNDKDILLLPNIRCLELHSSDSKDKGVSYIILRNLAKYPALELLAINLGRDGISLFNKKINNRKNTRLRIVLLCETQNKRLDKIIKKSRKMNDLYIDYYDEGMETLREKIER